MAGRTGLKDILKKGHAENKPNVIMNGGKDARNHIFTKTVQYLYGALNVELSVIRKILLNQCIQWSLCRRPILFDSNMGS